MKRWRSPFDHRPRSCRTRLSVATQSTANTIPLGPCRPWTRSGRRQVASSNEERPQAGRRADASARSASRTNPAHAPTSCSRQSSRYGPTSQRLLVALGRPRAGETAPGSLHILRAGPKSPARLCDRGEGHRQHQTGLDPVAGDPRPHRSDGSRCSAPFAVTAGISGGGRTRCRSSSAYWATGSARQPITMMTLPQSVGPGSWITTFPHHTPTIQEATPLRCGQSIARVWGDGFLTPHAAGPHGEGLASADSNSSGATSSSPRPCPQS